MKTKDSGTPTDFPLHTIKKITTIGGTHAAAVNQLLSRGWILLALETREITPKEQHVIFTLGHTDPTADDSVDTTYHYIKPEDFGR